MAIVPTAVQMSPEKIASDSVMHTKQLYKPFGLMVLLV